MASPAPTRRVLGDLSVNTPTTDVRGDTRRGGDGSLKVQKVVDGGSSFGSLAGEKMAGFAREKRKLDGEMVYGSPKKARRENGAAAGSWVHNEAGMAISQGERTGSVPKRLAPQGDGLDDDLPSSRQTSPDSSLGSSQAAYNDSHHTVFTEPDDVPVPAMNPAHPITTIVAGDSRSLTREELRQRAKDGMLRLRLAGYKVRTNQVDVPMAQLQIRSSSHSTSTSFADSYAASSNNRRRQTVPTRTIHLPEPPSLREGDQTSQILSSFPHLCNDDISAADDVTRIPDSPRKDERGINTPRDGFATPLLPRQRGGLLDPPQLGSPTPNTPGDELTSSVVKGRAADGLLSLMGLKK